MKVPIFKLMFVATLAVAAIADGPQNLTTASKVTGIKPTKKVTESRKEVSEPRGKADGKKRSGVMKKKYKVFIKLKKTAKNKHVKTDKEGGRKTLNRKKGGKKKNGPRETKRGSKNKKGERKNGSKKTRKKMAKRGFKYKGSKQFLDKINRRSGKEKSKEITDLESQYFSKAKKKEKAMLKMFLKACASLLQKIKKRKKESHSVIPDAEESSSFEVLGTINTFGIRLAEDIGWSRKAGLQTVPFNSDNIAMEVSTVKTDNFTALTIPTKTLIEKVNDSITFPSDVFGKGADENGTIIASFYEAFQEMENATGNSSIKSAFVNSHVVSAEVNPPPEGSLSAPVKVVFRNIMESPLHTPVCAFWDYNKSDTTDGGWDTRGCHVYAWNRSHTECHCNHLTDFAVLFRTRDEPRVEDVHTKIIGMIGFVGIMISIIALTLTLLTFLIMRKLLRSERNLIHVNLAAALLIANVVFLFAHKAHGEKIPCFIVTVVMFYFFLCAFAWMLVEGIHIWILLTQVFEERSRFPAYLFVGWGTPAILVAIAAGILKYNLMSTYFCWLSPTNGAIWAFVGPVAFVIIVNTIVLIKALYLTYKHNRDKETVSGIRSAARCCLILMPILGITWVFGFLMIKESHRAFEYLFTIFSCLQGLFILLFYVILNTEVRREYQSIRRKQKDSQTVGKRVTNSTSAGSRADDPKSRVSAEMKLVPKTVDA